VYHKRRTQLKVQGADELILFSLDMYLFTRDMDTRVNDRKVVSTYLASRLERERERTTNVDGMQIAVNGLGAVLLEAGVEDGALLALAFPKPIAGLDIADGRARIDTHGLLAPRDGERAEGAELRRIGVLLARQQLATPCNALVERCADEHILFPNELRSGLVVVPKLR